jgi:HAD superfamily hydrolase (TIGR01509 family)
MTPRQPTALLFDVMGTLVYEPFYREVPSFFGMSLREIIEQKHPTAWIDFECGHIDEATMMARFFADGRSFDHAGLRTTMRDAYRWLDGMQELMSELQAAGWPMHLLSNYPDWYRIIEDKLTLSRFASWRFVSCRMGVRKPDAEAYLIPARELGLPPAELLFIDDRKENCDAALALGLDAIVFEDAAQLRRELQRRGVRRRP